MSTDAVMQAFKENSGRLQGYENSRKYTALHSDVCVELFGTPFPRRDQQDKAEDKIQSAIEDGELEVFRTHPAGTKAVRRPTDR